MSRHICAVDVGLWRNGGHSGGCAVLVEGLDFGHQAAAAANGLYFQQSLVRRNCLARHCQYRKYSPQSVLVHVYGTLFLFVATNQSKKKSPNERKIARNETNNDSSNTLYTVFEHRL